LTAHASEAAVDGLAFEVDVGCLYLSDDIAPRELGGAGALLESGDGVEDGGSAARSGIGDLGLQGWDG
jgi:hypothetical protein